MRHVRSEPRTTSPRPSANDGIESDLRRRELLQSASATIAHDKPAHARTADAARASAASAHSGGRRTAMAHDVISTCPVCSSELAVTRLHCRELRDDPRGRLQRRPLRPPEPRAADPPRELPPIARQPARDGARARDQLPDRPVARRGPRPGARLRPARRRDGADERGRRRRQPDPRGRARRSSQALARHEMSAEDAAAAIRALGRTASMTATRPARASTTPSAPRGSSSSACVSGDDPPPRDRRRRRSAFATPRGMTCRTTFSIELGPGSATLRSDRGLGIPGLRGGGAADLEIDLPRRASVVIDGTSTEIDADGLVRRPAATGRCRATSPCAP